jgi:DnaK suppressor protein
MAGTEMTGRAVRSAPMPGKKPGTKISKPKKPAPAKAAARRPEPKKSAPPSRKPVAPAARTPPAKSVRHAETKTRSASTEPTPAAAPAHRSLEREHPPVSTIPPRLRAGPEAEESEGPEAGSLLAGPRNVKPYVAKRGEQYMSKEQLTHFQQILLNWKRDLMEEVDRTVSHMKDEAANFPDPNDRATQEEEFSLELRTRDRERKLIRKIEEALKRIEDGSYGYCLETGEEIGIKRLEARPVATLSIEAQERRERRERQYGDRDDRYR